MQNKSIRKVLFSCFFFLLLIAGVSSLGAQEMSAVNNLAQNVAQANEGMTLWDMIKAGGFIMVILLIISLLTIALVVYCFIMVDPKKLVPNEFFEQVVVKLEEQNSDEAKDMAAGTENIVGKMVVAGMEKKQRGDMFVQEAVDSAAKKELTKLWQYISYLADVATVAPLIGLLGTVLGMIQAFNVIAFQTAVVKPILLAGGVSKAMVTTAGGLIVAIPTMLVYAYFRGRVQEISNAVETYSADLIRHIQDLKSQGKRA